MTSPYSVRVVINDPFEVRLCQFAGSLDQFAHKCFEMFPAIHFYSSALRYWSLPQSFNERAITFHDKEMKLLRPLGSQLSAGQRAQLWQAIKGQSYASGHRYLSLPPETGTQGETEAAGARQP